MKLLNKISFLYIINTVVVFSVGFAAIYLAVEYAISSQVNSQLEDTADETASIIESGDSVENSPFIEAEEVNPDVKPTSIFKDTTIYFQDEKIYAEYREFSTVKEINGRNYQITVTTSLIGREDLFSAILIVMASTLALLLIILFFVNRRSTKKIFRPFYENLKELEGFSLQNNKSPQLKESNIEEFKELNNSLTSLSGKALKEYNSLKEFTEDLSHELHTPVAIIKTKLELILQKEIVDEDIISYVKAAYQNITRLDKLNRSLVLLAKLEAKEMFPPDSINLADKVNKAAADFSEIAQMKKINVKTNINSDFMPLINESLLDMVLGNLISNAIKHNIYGGEVLIDLNSSTLVIQNTGNEPKQKPEMYFERFSYDNKTDNSLGLGLAITKKICTAYGFQIDYVYKKPFHIITILLK